MPHSKFNQLVSRALRMHWALYVLMGVFAFLVIRLGGEWAAVKFHASMAIAPTGSFPPAPPQSWIELLTWLGGTALVVCLGLAILSAVSNYRANTKAA